MIQKYLYYFNKKNIIKYNKLQFEKYTIDYIT